METVIRIVPAGQSGQDRAAVVAHLNGHFFLLADGAGGMSGGDLAADAVIDGARSSLPTTSDECVQFLHSLDRRMPIGQTTAVIAFVSSGSICGASVGDSEAWMITESDVVVLRRLQRRKPLLGSGEVVPVAFGPVPVRGRLLMGSDGLFKYVRHERIRELALGPDLASASVALVDAARLRSGALQDDLAVILAG